MSKRKEGEYVDITPKWAGMFTILLTLYECDKTKADARKELWNMALAADAYNECVEPLTTALQELFKHCAMIHNKWGEGCNSKEADAAIEAGHVALAKAEAAIKSMQARRV